MENAANANNKKLKVLFLIEGFDKGGIEKVTLDIVNNLDLSKYDITVQTFWYGGFCQSQVRSEVKVIPFFFKRYVRGVIRLIKHLSPKMLYRLFIRGKYDVEIACSDGGAAKVISGSNNKNSKKIAWVHMDVEKRGSKLPEFLDREAAGIIYNSFDKIICVSENCRKSFVKKFGFSDMVAVAHNPVIDFDIIRKSSDFCPFQKETRVVELVSVGRLEIEKGYERLINCCERLLCEGIKFFRLHIVGDGGLFEALKKQICGAQLENIVILEGFQPNPYPYIANADFYICSSLDEAYPLTIGESLILGTPVIGTSCAGVCEWLGDQEYGIVVDNDEDSLLSGMREIILQKDVYREKWRSRVRQKAQDLTFAKTLAEWENEFFGE